MQRRHRTVHARIWTALVILLPAILIAALALRQVGPTEAPAQKIASETGADAGEQTAEP
jgi:hypothetical protein